MSSRTLASWIAAGWGMAALAGMAPAQSTWVVDASAGPGHDFTEIQSAIDAASPGDRIEIRSGTYRAVLDVRKGVDLVGLTDDVIFSPAQIEIADLPRGEFLRLDRVELNFFSRLSIADCSGGVHLHGIKATSSFVVTVARSRNVSVIDSELSGILHIDADSFLFLAGSSVTARASGTAGIAVHGELLAIDSTIRGSPGSANFGSFCQVTVQPGGPGIDGTGRVTLMSCEVHGVPGGWAGEPYCPVFVYGGPAISTSELTELVITDDCTLSPSEGVYDAFRTSDFPTLSVPPQVDRGSALTVNLAGQPGSLFLVFASIHHDVIPVAGVELPIQLWLPGVAQGPSFFADSSGRASWTLIVPDIPSLQNRMFYLQAVALRDIPVVGSLTNMDAVRVR